MLKAFVNCIILSDGTEQSGKAVLIENDIIADVVAISDVPVDVEVTDLGGAYLAPGFIDLQIYGSGGKLFGGSPSVEALEQMENDLLAQGTTGFLAAVATNTPQIVEQAIAAAKAYRKKAKGNFLGLHLEGPYLNPVRKGAHPAELIKKGTLTEIKSWVEQAEGEIRIMTIAPELQDEELIDYLNQQGIVISCGHSNATYEEASGFFSKVQAATHLYNAMPPIHHREPGLVPAIFKQKPYTSIVADGIHVSYPMIELAKRELGDRLFLITDAVTSTSEGIYPHVFTGDRYTMPDGTLSGSALTMLKAVQNCTENAGIPLAEAVNMASLYPARLIKSDKQTGRIAKGFKANLTAFDSEFSMKVKTFNGSEF
ncbi:MAG: N-acetylglucosamine-6-phosphate deacetylase [Sphingobacteriaceae bacterium]|jgi:N-acetylglucosamine-6-phosphate deacetylase|nr:N-acetylglucosamine-6-phosphate deacetylase [Sphingobacteriaceae bacterium]